MMLLMVLGIVATFIFCPLFVILFALRVYDVKAKLEEEERDQIQK